jgi:hypothetical protein
MVVMGVGISWKLTGPGWAECTFRVGDAEVIVTASRLSEALGDLVEGVTTAVRGGRAAVSFAEEPGEFLWVLEPTGAGVVRIDICEYADWRRRGDRGWASDGKPIFSAECRLRTLAGALVSEVQRLEREHGPAGYEALWGYPLPTWAVAELRQALREGKG